MLLEFKVKNYKSFLKDTSFSMMAAPKQKGLDYSLCVEKYKSINIYHQRAYNGHNDEVRSY